MANGARFTRLRTAAGMPTVTGEGLEHKYGVELHAA